MPASQAVPPRTCPRCRGQMFVERDLHGTYGSCIICGYVHDVLIGPPIDFAAEEASRPPRIRRRGPSHAQSRL